MWSIDSVSDALFDGRRLQALTVVDAFTREALAIDVDQGIKGGQVVEAMARVSLIRGAPRTDMPTLFEVYCNRGWQCKIIFSRDRRGDKRIIVYLDS
jgi:hypothetical protein